jgi:acyl-CoA synthetase (AMP-forming)/AMP-acid ligase II
MGLLAIGAIPAMINFNLTSKPLLHCLTAAEAKLFIFDSEIAQNVEQIKESLVEAGIRSICLVDPTDNIEESTLSWTELLHEDVIARHSAQRPPDSLRTGRGLVEMAMLMYTSGTTGLPKPAVISHNKLASAPGLFVDWSGIKPSDVFYSCMPLYHATALILGVGLVISGRCTFALGHKFSTQTFWQEVRDSRATSIQYVGEMCRYLLSSPESPDDKNHAVRMAFGNGMRPDVWNRFRYRFGVDTIAELYAATGMQFRCGTYCRGQWRAVELQLGRLWIGIYWETRSFGYGFFQTGRRGG